MMFKKSSRDELVKKIDLYRKRSLESFAGTKAIWTKSNKDLRNRSLLTSEGYSVFVADLEELLLKADFGDMGNTKLRTDVLFAGVDERDYRIANVLKSWEERTRIDPPAIFADNLSIYFDDGRHRTIVAFHLGEKEIPVMVHSTSYLKVSRLITLNKLN